jgi:hypothetical protein
MEVLPHLGKAQHRRADATGQDVEGDQLADRQAAVDDEPGAEIPAVTILLTSCTSWLAVFPRLSTRKLAPT